MGRRIDYIDDPDAPEPNSLVPSVNMVVTNDDGEVLLIRRSDSGNWALPGGAIELGESVTQAATRETLEETGVSCHVLGISGIYSNPRHLVEYTSNGEVRQEFTIVLMGRPESGAPTASDESSEVEWVNPADLPSLAMTDAIRARLEHAFSGRPPHVD